MSSLADEIRDHAIEPEAGKQQCHDGKGFEQDHRKLPLRQRVSDHRVHGLRSGDDILIALALHNVAKHSGATEVWLRIHVADSILEICVEDNGKGVGQRDGNRQGNGLLNMQQRMENIGGEFVIASELGQGTKIQLRIRL